LIGGADRCWDVWSRDQSLHLQPRERPTPEEVLDRAPGVFAGHGFDPRPLEPFRRRLANGRLPADDLVAHYERERTIPGVLRHLVTPVGADPVQAGRVAV